MSQFGSSGDGALYQPEGIAIDISGDVYVADTRSGFVKKFDSSGTFLTEWRTFPNISGGFGVPVGIATDVVGNVYVTDTSRNFVQKYDSNGVYLSEWGSEGSEADQFDSPSGITADLEGNIYVADADNDRIQKFSYPPTTSTVAVVNPDGTPEGTDVVLTTNAYSDITCHSNVAESSLEVSDSTKDYPLGLVDFCLTVPSGSTQKIDLLFETDLVPGDVVARKYNSVTKTYRDVPNATITEETISGKHYLRLTYSITDGGALDDDGIVNGEILDPVGLGTVPVVPSDVIDPPDLTTPTTPPSIPGSLSANGSNSTAGTLAITGANSFFLVLFSSGLLLAGAVLRKKSKRHL